MKHRVSAQAVEDSENRQRREGRCHAGAHGGRDRQDRKREDRQSDERSDARKNGGHEQAQNDGGVEREQIEDDVRHAIVKCDWVGRTDPAQRARPVFVTRQQLGRADENCEEHAHQPEHHRASEAQAAQQNIEAQQERDAQQRVDRDLVVSAVEREARDGAREGHAHDRAASVQRAQREQQYQGSPHSAVQHLRPLDVGHVARQRERCARANGGETAQAQVACQQIAEQRGEKVDQDEIPVRDLERDVAVPERRGPEQPIQREEHAGLILSQQRLAAPVVRVPDGKLSVAPLPGLFGDERQHLRAEVAAVEPGVLVGERDFPKHRDRQREKDQRRPGSPERARGEAPSRSVAGRMGMVVVAT